MKYSREIFFVCSAILDNGDLITKSIQASTIVEASAIFNREYLKDPKIILGPFVKLKQIQVESVPVQSLKFTNNKFRKAEYDGWLVNAFSLIEPNDSAYLIFLKRLDNKKIPMPKGTIIKPLSDLKFIL